MTPSVDMDMGNLEWEREEKEMYEQILANATHSQEKAAQIYR